MLKDVFTKLLLQYTNNTNWINELWDEIEKKYSNPKRQYHSLEHLDNVSTQIHLIKDKINNWHSTLFALYYHDVIYNVLRSDNEEKSAAYAELRLKKLLVPLHIIQLCTTQILATKSHQVSTNSDTNYFTDADLSILGESCEKYQKYYQNVRNEYYLYPNIIYNTGRKKVLDHFLSMDRIFKTDYFYDKFEIQARKNIQIEINLLS